MNKQKKIKNKIGFDSLIHLKISVFFFFKTITLIIFSSKVTQFKIVFVSTALSLAKLKILITFSVYSQKCYATCMYFFYYVAIELIKKDTIYSVSYFCCRKLLHTPAHSHVDIRLLFYYMLGDNDRRCCYNSFHMIR